MALGDITIYDESQFGYPGDVRYANGSGSIYAGEPVVKVLGNTTGYYVDAAATNSPQVGTHYMAGIAATSQTVAGGKVRVMKLVPGVTYLIAPNDSTAWDTQAEYDALVGHRVLFDLTTGTYTILAADNAAGIDHGLVVMPLDIYKYHNLVRFAIREAVNYLA